MESVNYDNLSDEALTTRMKAGDEKAFSVLVTRHYTCMVSLSVSILGCESLASDAVQEAFLQFWRSIHQFEGRSDVRYWLSRIVWRSSLQVLRKDNRYRGNVVSESIVGLPPMETGVEGLFSLQQDLPSNRLEIKELRARLIDAVSQLPPKYQVVFILYEIEGESLKSISSSLQLSLGAVKSRLFRAREELRRHLRDDYSS